MFELVQNLYGGAKVTPPKDNMPFQVADEEAGVAGRVYKMSGGKLTAATGTSSDAFVVAVDSCEEGGYVRGYYVLPGMVFKCKVTGTKHANFVVGVTTALIDSTGDSVDWASAPVGGPLTVLRIDLDNKYVWVTFNKSALAK